MKTTSPENNRRHTERAAGGSEERDIPFRTVTRSTGNIDSFLIVISDHTERELNRLLEEADCVQESDGDGKGIVLAY